MKAIILAAWEWVRLKPLTNDIPKALVEVYWKSLLEHNLEKIYKFVDEIIIVIAYKKEKIIEKFWDNYAGVKISYHYQNITKKWTGGAIMGIEIKDEFIILFADMLLSDSDIQNILMSKNPTLLTMEVNSPKKYGICSIDKNGNLIEIIEKPQDFIGNLANTGCIKADEKLLEEVKKIKLSSRWEYELTDAINSLAKKSPIQIIRLQEKFIDITSLEDLERIEKEGNFYK